MIHDATWEARFAASLTRLGECDREYTFRIANGYTGKPRASSLGSCARQQWYAMRQTPVTDAQDPPWPTMMGYAGEAIAREVLRDMGYSVDTATIPDDLPYSGHVDDIISGLDLGDERVVWDNKVRGVYGMRTLMTKGLPAADPEMYVQMQAYMAALGLRRAMLTILPHDLRLMMREVRTYKLAGSPLVHRIMVNADAKTQEIARARAVEIAGASALDVIVRREFNPASKAHEVFPCGFCEWRSRCLADDFTTEQIEVTRLPDYELDLEA